MRYVRIRARSVAQREQQLRHHKLWCRVRPIKLMVWSSTRQTAFTARVLDTLIDNRCLVPRRNAIVTTFVFGLRSNRTPSPA